MEQRSAPENGRRFPRPDSAGNPEAAWGGIDTQPSRTPMKKYFTFRNCLRILYNTAFAVYLSACNGGFGCNSDSASVIPSFSTNRITFPAQGATITTLPSIQGVNTLDIDFIKITLTRVSDGKVWNGSAWSPPGSYFSFLPVVSGVTGTGNFTTTGPMPAGSNADTGLLDGFYLIDLAIPGGLEPRIHEYYGFRVGATPLPVATVPFAWGYNGNGAVGNGPGPSANAATKVLTTGALAGKVVVSVATGAEHTLALGSDGQVYAWGRNDRGQLGLGYLDQAETVPDTNNRDVPTLVPMDPTILPIVGIGAGDYHSLAVSLTGRIVTWGDNTGGQLGKNLGSPTFMRGPSSAPEPKPLVLPPDFLPLVSAVNRLASVVTGGSNFSVARSADGKVFAWGTNTNGQIGDGTNAPRYDPVEVTGLAGKTIVAVSSGSYHTLVKTSLGEVYAWGAGASGLLGNGSNANSNTAVRTGLTGAMAGKQISSISASRLHSLALASDGTVFVWGSNANQGLGDGGVLTLSNVPLQVGGNLTGLRATRIAAGWFSSLVATADARLFAWGGNISGNLCGAAPLGANASVPTAAVAGNAITPYNIPALMATGWDHAVLLTVSGPGPVPELLVQARGAQLTNGSELIVGTNVLGTSSAVTVTVTNRGSGDLVNLVLRLTGSTSFTATPLSTTHLAPGQSLTVNVTYNATALGAAAGVLELESNDILAGLFRINLTGNTSALGAVDPTFPDPNVVGAVNAIGVQTDHRVVIGGTFASAGGSLRNNLARFLPNGALDATFNPNVNGPVNCLAVQPDGAIVIAGSFTMVGATPRNRIARILADGTLDPAFNPNALDGVVNALHLNPNGSLYFGGSFSRIGAASPSFLVRVTAGGAVDASFNAALSSQVRCLAVQDDGFLVLGGSFQTVGITPRVRVARVDPDGIVDTGFTADTTGGNVFCVLVQTDGRILIGGDFLAVNGTARSNIARLSASGVVDNTFTTAVTSAGTAVTGLARQANGRTLVTGSFTSLNGQMVGSMARIDDTGGTDGFFRTGAGGPVNGAMLVDDGHVYVGGNFSILGGTVRGSFARLTLENVAQSFDTLSFPGVVNWVHGASFPETVQATLEASTNGGGTWVPFGAGVRLNAPQIGWTWFNASFPSAGLLRLRAFNRGGLSGGSSSLLETVGVITTPPQIRVTVNGQFLNTGTTQNFGAARPGGINVVTFTVTNLGTAPLSGLLQTTVSGSSDFQLFPPDSGDALAGGASTSLAVAFKPRSSGEHTAALSFQTNSIGSLYSINLLGTGGLPIEFWRQQYFNSPDNAGPGANAADGEGDGRPNLLEYATGTLPNKADKDVSFFQSSNGVIFFFYQRAKQALADVTYQVEYANSLAGPWLTAGVGEFVYADDGVTQMVQAIVPQDSSPHRFARLRVTQNAP